MIAYADSAAEVVPDELAGFFVGWPSPPALDRRLELLRRSDAVSLAYDDRLLVGFATAITDSVLAAFIPVLEVLPSPQRQGIGTGLIERLLAQLDELYMVDVVCDAPLEPFYAQLGFITLDRAMGLRRREKIA